MAIFLCKVRKVPRKSPRQVRKSDAGGESLKLFKENGPIFGRNGDSNCALEEKALELTFKIGGEGLLADGGADFFECPKASTIKFGPARAHDGFQRRTSLPALV